MKKSIIFVFGVLALLIFTASSALAVTGPRAYLTEQVKADYDWDGTLDTGQNWTQCEPDGNPCKYGFLEVGVPNTQDVLQNIRINISSVTDTNLNSKEGYKGALASPTTQWERTKLRFNSSADGDNGDDDLYYNISNDDTAPSIKLSMEYFNDAGGKDLYDEENIEEFVSGYTSANSMTFNFTIENPGTNDLNGVDITLQFNKNTGADVLNVTSASDNEGTGTPSATDSENNDDYRDRVTWSGDLTGGKTFVLTVNADMEEVSNFPDGTEYVDLDGTDKGAQADWSNTTNTLTDKSILGKFSKGPIRQGTDLANSTTGWDIRGLIRHMGNDTVGANNLTYNVTSWALYNVTTDGQLDQEVQSGDLNPSLVNPGDGRIYTTGSRSGSDWYSTGEIGKPYFATKWTWEVVWDDTSPENLYAFVNTSLNMPLLYKIDMDNTKSIAGTINPDYKGDPLTITDNTTHIGSNQSPAKRVEILSVVPGTKSDGTTDTLGGGGDTYFDINETKNVTVYFSNDTSDYEITSDYEVDMNEPGSDGSDGLVNITIPDCSAVPTIGHDLNDSETIKINYDVVTNTTMTAGDKFSFSGNTSMTTTKGTPMTEAHPITNITVTAKRLTGYKDLIAYNPKKPTLINGSIVVSVTDTSTNQNGITGIKFMDYVPEGTDFNTSNVTVKLNGNPLSGGDLQITDNGTVTIDGTTVHAYEYSNGEGGWHLNNSDQINVTYQMNITSSGLYEMPSSIMGVDPDTGVEFRSAAVGLIKVRVPKSLKPLDIRQRDLKLAKRITVGNPAEWVKKFEVYNPNSRPADGTFETKVFKDAEKAWVTYTDQTGNLVKKEGSFKETDGGRIFTWKDEINPLETRSYEVKVLTSPVIETDRDIEVLEQLSKEKVKLRTDVYLRKFADETYEDVVLNLPIPKNNIIRARDGYGKELRITGGKESTSVIVDKMEENRKTVSITYKQPYPTIKVVPEKESFSLKSPVALNIIVINGGQEINYPKIETEIYAPNMEIVKTRIKELESLEPREKTELTERYRLSTNLPTGQYIAKARFRENFATVSSGTGKFYVKGSMAPGDRTIPFLILLIAIAIVGYLSYKRLKAVKE